MIYITRFIFSKTLGGSEPISIAVITYIMLLVLSNFYSTLCTIINSSPIITGGSLLSTNTIIIQVLTEKRNIKIGSSQIVLVAHTKEKRKITTI